LTFLLENSNLILIANQYVEKTQRLKTGNDGKITLQEVFFFFFSETYLLKKSKINK